jgi:hypothetical protein
MSSLSLIHEGTISAQPFHDQHSGRIEGSHNRRITGSGESGKSGTLHGCEKGGKLHGSRGTGGGDRFAATRENRLRVRRWPRSTHSFHLSGRSPIRRKAFH